MNKNDDKELRVYEIRENKSKFFVSGRSKGEFNCCTQAGGVVPAPKYDVTTSKV